MHFLSILAILIVIVWLSVQLYKSITARRYLVALDAILAEHIGSMYKIQSEYELSKSDNFGQSLQRDEHSQIGGYSNMNGSVGPTQPQPLSTLEASKTGKNKVKTGTKTAKAVKNAAGKPPKRGKSGR